MPLVTKLTSSELRTNFISLDLKVKNKETKTLEHNNKNISHKQIRYHKNCFNVATSIDSRLITSHV